PSRCNPGKDEHQLVHGVAEAPSSSRYGTPSWERRAPARPWCSRRARPPSQRARYAVRTRGGCSYKATPEESWLIESDRGPWARRSQAACTPGAQRTRATPTRAGATPGRTSTSSSAVQRESPSIEPASALRCSHPGAGAPTRRRQRKDGSSSSIAARGRDAPTQRVPPGRSAPALRQPEQVQSREGRAPARPWCSRRTRPSSHQAHYAVRTRGGCSYKAATPERGELIESDRGPWARRSQVTCTPGAQRTRA